MFEVDKMKKKLWFLFIGFSIICSFLNAQQTITVRADKLRLSSGTVVTITSLAPYDAKYFTSQAEGGLSAEEVVTANGKSLIQAANYAAMRTLLDLEVGVDFNAYITALSGITNGIKVTGAAAAYDEITHDGSNVIYNSSVGAHVFQLAGGAGAGILKISDGGGTPHYLGLQPPTMAADFTFVFPPAIGAEGQLLRTGASPFATGWTTAKFPATAGSAGNTLISDGTDWASANVLSAVPTGLTYTTATRAVSLTTGYMIPGAGTAGQILTSAGASAPAWTTAKYPATAGSAGNVPVSDGTDWASGNVLSAVPTGLTYTTATRALSLTANYFIPDTASGWTFDHLHITKGVYYTETDDGNSSTADTIDWTVGPAHKSTLTGNCTYTFTAPPSPCSLILRIVGDGTVRTVTWPNTVKWAAATKPTHTGTVSVIDLIAFYFDGTNYWAGATLDIR